MKKFNGYSTLDIPLGFEFYPDTHFGCGEVSLISSRPSQGKTAFITSVLNNLITSGKYNAAVFLPDMPTAEFFSRLVASRAGVDYGKVKRGFITRDDWMLLHKTMTRLSKARLWISASKRSSTASVRAEALKLAHELKLQKKKLDVVFIDSINSLSDFPERREDKTNILRALNRLAEDTGAAIVCAYSLEDFRQDDPAVRVRPQLRDFRTCGICEDEIGLIINIVRPEVHQTTSLKHVNVGDLDIVWSSSRAYGYSVPARFDPKTLIFYTGKPRVCKQGKSVQAP
ncbi:MAG: DnaB-like helicase C-terminal domain-containing protein [Elusimicrobiota bacterium]